MATDPKTIAYLVEQASGAGHVSAKKMFGEYGLYCDGKLVALVCDDQLFLKPTQAGRDFLARDSLDDIIEAPPYPSAKPCLLIDGDRWDDREWLSDLIKLSAAEVPAGTPRRNTPRTNTPRKKKR